MIPIPFSWAALFFIAVGAFILTVGVGAAINAVIKGMRKKSPRAEIKSEVYGTFVPIG